MENHEIQFGDITIILPDETLASFIIFEDLATLFEMKYQSEAVALLKEELKQKKLKPNIDYESDFTYIGSENADTIFEVATLLNHLVKIDKTDELSDNEQNEILCELKAWERPPAQQWKVGNIFSISLRDNTFSFGQIVGTHLNKISPIIAMLELKKDDINILEVDLDTAKVILVNNYNEVEFADYTFNILFTHKLLIEPAEIKNKDKSGISLINFANAYFGLEPWNVMCKEDYYDEFLQPEVERPSTAIWLSSEERIAYRKEFFGIDE